jgi:hypothetical protein
MKYMFRRFFNIAVSVSALIMVGRMDLYSQMQYQLVNPFNKIDARTTALADAYITDINNAGALYSNPAALVFLHQWSILANYNLSSFSDGTGFTTAAAFGNREDNAMAIGISLNKVPAAADTVSPSYFTNQCGIDFGGGIMIATSLSLGARVSMQYADTHDSKVMTGFTSIGLYYGPEPTVSYGFVYNGISLGSQYKNYQPSEDFAFQQVPSNFQIGISLQYPSSINEHILTVALANEKIVGERGLVYKAGIELCPFSILSLRAGYDAGISTSEARYGIGLETNGVQMSYAFVPRESGGPIHQLSFCIDP